MGEIRLLDYFIRILVASVLCSLIFKPFISFYFIFFKRFIHWNFFNEYLYFGWSWVVKQKTFFRSNTETVIYSSLHSKICNQLLQFIPILILLKLFLVMIATHKLLLVVLTISVTISILEQILIRNNPFHQLQNESGLFTRSTESQNSGLSVTKQTFCVSGEKITFARIQMEFKI